MTIDRPIASWVVKGAPATGAALLLYFVWRSLRWPLIHDTALMHYIAWLIGAGAVPYHDTFDMNMPGIYLIHLALLAVGGSGDIAFRVFDLGWLAATAGLMFFYCRPAGNRTSGVTAGLLFAIYHVSGGATLAGQRDFLLCIFLLAGAYGLARSSESVGASRRSLPGRMRGSGGALRPSRGPLGPRRRRVHAGSRTRRPRPHVRLARRGRRIGAVLPDRRGMDRALLQPAGRRRPAMALGHAPMGLPGSDGGPADPGAPDRVHRRARGASSGGHRGISRPRLLRTLWPDRGLPRSG